VIERYRIDPGAGRFTTRAFSAGLLSAFAHSPTFAVRDFGGEMRFEDGRVDGMSLDVTVRADSLDLLDQVGDRDRREIEGRMRRDVLEVAAFPEITYQAAKIPAEKVAQGEFRLDIGGHLTLHGVTRPRNVGATLRTFVDAFVLSGGFPLLLSDHRIGPVTALGGTIRLKDELRVLFEIVAFPEVP
jgi:polyisoprenoid-binding protein YceI